MKSLLTAVLILSASVSAFADHTQFDRAPFVKPRAEATQAAAAPVKAHAIKTPKASAAPAKAEPHSRSYPRFIGSTYVAPKADAAVKPAVRRVHDRANDGT